MRGRRLSGALWLLPLLAGCAAPATEDVDDELAPERPGLFVTTPSDGGGAALVIEPRARTRAAFAIEPDPGGAFGRAPRARGNQQTKRRARVASGGGKDDESGQVRFREAGYDVIKTHCGGIATRRYEVDWSSPAGERWIRGGQLEKDPFHLKRDLRLPPKPAPPSPPRVDEHGRPSGSVIPLR